MFSPDIPQRIRLGFDAGLDQRVLAGDEVVGAAIRGRTRAGSIEARRVLGCHTEDVEVVDAASRRAAGGEVGNVPGQRRAVTATGIGDRRGRGKAQGGESKTEQGGELHDGGSRK